MCTGVVCSAAVPHKLSLAPCDLMGHYLPQLLTQPCQGIPKVHGSSKTVIRVHSETLLPTDPSSPFLLKTRKRLFSLENLVLFPPGPYTSLQKKDSAVRQLPPIPMFGMSGKGEVFNPEIVSPTSMSLRPVSPPKTEALDPCAERPNLSLLHRCFRKHAGKDGVLETGEVCLSADGTPPSHVVESCPAAIACCTLRPLPSELQGVGNGCTQRLPTPAARVDTTAHRNGEQWCNVQCPNLCDLLLLRTLVSPDTENCTCVSLCVGGERFSCAVMTVCPRYLRRADRINW